MDGRGLVPQAPNAHSLIPPDILLAFVELITVITYYCRKNNLQNER